MRSPRAQLWWIAFVAAALGCGFSPPGDLACQDLAKVRCARQSSCTNGTTFDHVYGDLDTCIARNQLACGAAMAAPSTGETAARVEDCVRVYGGISCADLFADNLPAACNFYGRKKMGAACSFDVQCASGFCVGDRTSLCGQCGPGPTAGAGCVTSGCGNGQVCALRTLTCQAPGATGAPCDNNTLPCGADLTCVGGSSTVHGTCIAAIRQSGAPCGGTLGGCDGQIGLSCNGITTNRSCAAQTFLGDGLPCGSLPDGTNGVCSAGGECYTASGVALAGETGSCKAAALDGQPCDAVLGPPCLPPARCIFSGDAGTSGVCTLPVAVNCD